MEEKGLTVADALALREGGNGGNYNGRIKESKCYH